MRRSRIVAVLPLCVSSILWLTSALAEPPYVSDPDPNRPTLHVQPRALTPDQATRTPIAPANVVNGVTYVDVLAAAGFDIAGGDYGNEPAITANPLNPNQIVLTSFSGSDWPTGGNATFWYSGDGGVTWSYTAAVPPPPGTTTNYYCPCDQNMDWGRNGTLYGTFLHYNVDAVVASVYSAESTSPTNPASWIYRTPGGVAQTTNMSSSIYSDQPWIASGPLPADNSVTNVGVAYDYFNSGYSAAEMHASDSPGPSPLDFETDAATNTDGLQFGGSMNPGNRLAIGPDGKMYNLFQRFVSDSGGGIKQITYLITVSTDGGQTWNVANSDHASGGKIIAASVFSFQGNGSKIGGVNALLGGIDAITVDPKTGAAYVVYGKRDTTVAHDQLYLVKVTHSSVSGNVVVSAPILLTSSTIDNYLPSVAALPNGEVGVLFLTLSGSNFGWRFAQLTNGTGIVKSTGFPIFTSPFTNNGVSNQRIFGDYMQVRAVGCTFYGTFTARGIGTNNVNSINPYFMSAPAASVAPNACALPALTSLIPSAACAGSPGLNIALRGTGFTNGATGRFQGVLRPTTYNAALQVTTSLSPADLAAPGVVSMDLLGAAPAGGLTGSLPLTIEVSAASPGDSLRADPNGSNVALAWAAASGATSYSVKRCVSTSGPCTPASIAAPASNGYQDPVRLDADSYWYQIDAVNSCGATP